jgi:general stress protein CsbA
VTFTDQVNQLVTFDLFDASGRLVFQHEEFINDVFVTLDVVPVVAGTYYLGIKIGDNEEKFYPVVGGF